MDKITCFFRKILKNNIKTENGEIVKVIPKHSPGITPCITITNTGGAIKNGSEKLINLNTKLPQSHPLFDEENPNKTYPQQYRRTTNTVKILVNVWARTEQDRYNINNQIKNLIWMLKSDNHNLCPNKINEKLCSTTNTICPINLINNHHTIKGQCPNPKKYNYHSLFTKYNIIRGSFKNHPEYNQDELQHKQPLLRTIHEFNLDYYDFWNLGGNILKNTNFYE